NRVAHGELPRPARVVVDGAIILLNSFQNSGKVVFPVLLAPPQVERWHKSSIGIYKLNKDAAVRHGTNSSRVGGVIQDSDGLIIASSRS
ncbi:hypothetical protein TorRG33x02_031560, partial [Trema orientale]